MSTSLVSRTNSMPITSVMTAITIGSIEFVAKFFIYYMHERAWQLVPRGTIRHMANPEETT